MSNITLLQADNRPNLEYLLLTQQVNKKVCNHFGYKYLFITIIINIMMYGRRNKNQETDSYPFLQSKLRIQLQNRT